MCCWPRRVKLQAMTGQPILQSRAIYLPAGKQPLYLSRRSAPQLRCRTHRNRAPTYIGTRKRCGARSQRPQCTSAVFRCLIIHLHEPARQRARELANTPEFAKAQRQRKKVEALFAELKNQIGLRRLRSRRLKFVREKFFLAAAAQKHQAPGTLPQPTTGVDPARDRLVELPATKSRATRVLERTKRTLSKLTFSTPTGDYTN